MKQENNEIDWIDELVDSLTDKISLVTHFKTHKQRKQFFGEVKTIIKDSVAKNTNQDEPINKRSLHITRPNPNASAGFAVMTGEMSQKGDEALGVGPGEFPPEPKVSPVIEAARKHNKTVRHW